jgi:hypothetical protein
MSISKEADEILKRARKLIEDPARWTRAAFARDPAGNPLGWSDSAAVCWCSMGALYAISSDFGFFKTKKEQKAKKALNVAAHKLFGRDPAHVNDTRSHADVLLMFSAARWQ